MSFNILNKVNSFFKSPSSSRSGSPIFGNPKSARKHKLSEKQNETVETQNQEPKSQPIVAKNPREPSIPQRELPLRKKDPVKYHHTRQYTRRTEANNSIPETTPLDFFWILRSI